MSPARCPRCRAQLVEHEHLGAPGGPGRDAWWCDRCDHVVLADAAVRAPDLPERRDLA